MRGLLSVVVKAVDSAIKRDSASGDSFDVAIINQTHTPTEKQLLA